MKFPNIEQEACDACGRIRQTTIPFIDKHWVGLSAPECACGESGEFAVQVPRTDDCLDFTNEVYTALGEERK